MSHDQPASIAVTAPASLSVPELGPLVRAQSFKMPGRSLAPLAGIVGIVGCKVIVRSSLGLAGLVVVGGAFLAVVLLIERMPGLWRRLRLRRCLAWNGIGEPPSGAVRVTGRVRALGEPFRPPGEAGTVVFAHTRFVAAKDTGKASKLQREDVRGVTMEIELPTQTGVRIAPDAVRLLDSSTDVPEVGFQVRRLLGAAWLGGSKGKLQRSSLREGDRVEAVGEIVRDVSVDGAAGPGRVTPMIHWLIPAWKGGVWIRRLNG